MFLEKLDFLMAEKGINKNILSKGCGIPYTTIDGFYKKGYGNVKLSTLRTLSKYFNVDLNFWVDDITPNICDVYTQNSTKNEQQLVEHYKLLNDEGQEKLLDYSEDLVSSGRYKKHNINELDNKKQA